MRTNNQFLLDLLNLKIEKNKKMIEEIKSSASEEENSFMYEYKAKNKIEENEFLNEMIYIIPKVDDGIKYLKGCITKYKRSEEYIDYVSKISVLKQLVKEYKAEYRKSYKYLNKLSIEGMFNNDVFCDIIRDKIIKYTKCNRVTRKKYRHLTAFLNELLIEMQNADDPLKTLNHKLKLYERYKNTEIIAIQRIKKSKAEIIKEVLKEYNEKIKNDKRCI